MLDRLLVRAVLVEPLAGDPPMLDALLERNASLVLPKQAVPGYKIDRRFAAPEQGVLPIPIGRSWVVASADGTCRVQGFAWGDPPPALDEGARVYLIGMCSSPVVGVPDAESVAYITRKLDVKRAGLLAPEERLVVATSNGVFKSYRLPLRRRLLREVRWLAWGDRRKVLAALRRIPSLGKKISVGYGRVREWIVDRLDVPGHPLWPWWVDTAHGPLLMRPLPAGDYGGLLPAMIGAKQGFEGVAPPYWHPERYTDVVVPC